MSIITLFDRPIEVLLLPARPYNALVRNGIEDLDDLRIALERGALSNMKGIGWSTHDQIVAAYEKYMISRSTSR